MNYFSNPINGNMQLIQEVYFLFRRLYMRWRSNVALLSLFVGASISISCAKAPKIEITPTTYNCGTFYEGKVEKLKAVFNVKNSGDDILRIQEVRPGCGCTVVEFDTLVAPGKSGVIHADVNLNNIHTGEITKTVNVSSNAANNPSIMLTITAKINAIVDISDQYINVAGNKLSPAVLYLSSQKKNLKVTEITFKSSIAKKDAPEWQQQTPVIIHYKWSPTDSVRSDGYTVYKLEVFKPDQTDSDYGEMTIKTNHPGKSSIVIQANITK
jgi:hypothetical protein